MKNNMKLLMYTVLFVVFIGAAVLLYNDISNDFSPENSQVTDTEKERNPASDFTMYNNDGEEVALSSFEGTPVVINFWASWCGVCTTEFPHFENAYKKYGDKVQFLMVNMTDGSYETIGKAKSFIKEKGYTFPVFYDKDFEAAMAYSVTSIPVTVFIDGEGNLVHHRVGGMNESMLYDYIETLLGE